MERWPDAPATQSERINKAGSFVKIKPLRTLESLETGDLGVNVMVTSNATRVHIVEDGRFIASGNAVTSGPAPGPTARRPEARLSILD
jgi:hypothetical protein